jgi:hypothetical protein
MAIRPTYFDSVDAWGNACYQHLRDRNKPLPGWPLGRPENWCILNWPYAESEGDAAASLECEHCKVSFVLRPDALRAMGEQAAFVRMRLKLPTDGSPPWPLYNLSGRGGLLDTLREQAKRGLYPGERVFLLAAHTEQPRTTSWARLLEDEELY